MSILTTIFGKGGSYMMTNIVENPEQEIENNNYLGWQSTTSNNFYLKNSLNITNGIYFNTTISACNNPMSADRFDYKVFVGIDTNFATTGSNIRLYDYIKIDTIAYFGFFNNARGRGECYTSKYLRLNNEYNHSDDLITDDLAPALPNGNGCSYKQFINENGYYDGAFAQSAIVIVTATYTYSQNDIYTITTAFEKTIS
jgi:hypothetical protein